MTKHKVTYLMGEDEVWNPRRTSRLPKVNFRIFSGRSWESLEDIWPRDMRMNLKEVYGVIAVMAPALKIFRKRCKENYGSILNNEDLFTLFWIQRCEEAKENVCIDQYSVSIPMNWQKQLSSIKRSRLFRFQLIESMPTPRGTARLFRVTADGKMLMREFAEILEQCHRDIKYTAGRALHGTKSKFADQHVESINRYLSEYCFDWMNLDLTNKK